MSQLKLERVPNVSVASWINDKPISTEDWEVFTSYEDGSVNVIVMEKGGTAKLRLQIKQYVQYENINQKQEPKKEETNENVEDKN
jgi:hypothetical protein